MTSAPPLGFGPVEQIALTTAQVAQRLQLTAETIRSLAHAGVLPCLRTGRDLRFWWPAVVEALSQPRPLTKGLDAPPQEPSPV